MTFNRISKGIIYLLLHLIVLAYIFKTYFPDHILDFLMVIFGLRLSLYFMNKAMEKWTLKNDAPKK